MEITKEKKSKKNIPIVEIKSTFQVEDSVLMNSLEKNIIKAIQNGKRIKKGKYIVSVAFIITKDGTVSDVRCDKDPGFGMCEEVVRQVKKSPKWKPALQTQEVKEYQNN
ncbi:MAG: hypothetical protein ABL929_13275 [Ferruginibacter sp.]